jgi:hypothetical protein
MPIRGLLLGALTLVCTIVPVRDLFAQERGLAHDIDAFLKDLPEVTCGVYRADPYIRAAASLQKMGQEKAVEALSRLAKNRDQSKQVIVLCRMLFAKKPGGEFRRARIGGAEFVGDTDYAEWPLEPIELVDGVPFLVTIVWRGAPFPESAHSYLVYCKRNCDWSGYSFVPKTKDEKQKALDAILASPKLKGRLEDAEKALLSSQIK